MANPEKVARGAGNPDFANAQAILNRHCTGCHGANNPKDGISLTSHEAILKGGRGGAVVMAGNPDGSLLIDVLRHRNGREKMPPAGPIPEQEILDLEAWVTAGAQPQ
jgi:mono/diheme cytochrome c family protein